ncbi:MAG: low temperature requirement protein A, partial [Solirubrobacteraceae bacterium]|nr:low temperature requirement protein A [Patulibacter sp.]
LVLQVGRNSAALAMLRPTDPLFRTFQRLLVWSLASAPLWLIGGFSDEGLRPVFWAVALAIELTGPIARYAVPGLGRSETSDWAIDGEHFAERFQLLIIIALGESIVVTGASAADAGLGAETIGALSIAFLQSAALWWLYFDAVAEHSSHDIAHHEDPGRLARDAYTYLHLPIFAGIILSAIADEILILHPTHELSLAGAIVTLGGPLLYLIGDGAFRYRMVRSVSPRRLTAIAALALLAIPTIWLPAVAVGGCILAVLIALAIWEYGAS